MNQIQKYGYEPTDYELKCIQNGLQEHHKDQIEDIVEKIDWTGRGYISAGDLNEFIEEYEGRDVTRDESNDWIREIHPDGEEVSEDFQEGQFEKVVTKTDLLKYMALPK